MVDHFRLARTLRLDHLDHPCIAVVFTDAFAHDGILHLVLRRTGLIGSRPDFPAVVDRPILSNRTARTSVFVTRDGTSAGPQLRYLPHRSTCPRGKQLSPLPGDPAPIQVLSSLVTKRVHDRGHAVILTVATHWRADYEWYAHADPAVGNGALTTGDLNRIAARERGLADPAADVASALVRELLDTTDVSDRTWAEAAALFGDRAAVEIVVLAGYYSSLAMLIRGFRTPLPPEASTPEAWPPYPSQ